LGTSREASMGGSERTDEKEEDEVAEMEKEGIVILAGYCEDLSFPLSETD